MPWLMYTTIELNGGTYNHMKDDGVIMLIFLLVIVLALYFLLLVASKFVMYNWMTPVFVLTYLAIIIIACVV